MKKNKIKLFSIFLIINFFSVNVYDQTNQANTAILANIDSQQIGSDTLIIGKKYLLSALDPAQGWDVASISIIDQVCEGLFTYDLFDPDMPIIPRLASDFGSWSDDGTNYTVPLRQNVTFHNGYEFNASTVKFTFDRLDNLMNLSILSTESIFMQYGAERLINRTIVIDPYTVKFVLNYPFLAFLPILCFSPTFIVEEHSVPWDSSLENNETLIGTGPYKYISQDGEEVKFESYPDYYREIPDIEKIIYKRYDTEDEISQAILAGDIHFSYDLDEKITDYIEDFIASEKIMVEGSQVKSTIHYLGMNNENLNITMRRAINYAIDYDHIINDIYDNKLVRMTSIVPPGILYHKDCDVPTFNLRTARQTLIDAGLSKGLTINSPDYQWVDLSFSDPIVIANYTYTIGRESYENIGYSIANTLRHIGIKVSLDGYPTFWEYLNKLRLDPDEVGLFFIGWGADYNDPINFINTLLSNTSMMNFCQTNDPWLEQMMNDTLYETVESVRQEMYNLIQDYIALNLMPFAPIGYRNSPKFHSYEIKNIPYNSLNKLEIYLIEWDLDTDEDDIIDSKENALYFTDSNDNDTDDDDLSDGDEINTYLTNPKKADSDYDGIPDGWEVSHSLNPLYHDSSSDNDNDGLSNLEEYFHDTDPNDSDSDDDTLLDGEEVVLGSDGYVTNPNDPDSDDDTFNDGEEAERKTNPLNPHEFPTFWTDYSEYIFSISAGIVGGIFTLLIERIFRKRKKKEKL